MPLPTLKRVATQRQLMITNIHSRSNVVK